MSLGAFATMTLLTKNSFLDEIRKQYVLTARAKGCSERQVLYGHVFRNAMLIVIAGFPGAFVARVLHRLAADRDDLLARRARPARLREHPQPRLSGGVRHALHLLAGRAGREPDLRPDLYAGSIRASISRRGRSDMDARVTDAPCPETVGAGAAGPRRPAGAPAAAAVADQPAALGQFQAQPARLLVALDLPGPVRRCRCSPNSSPTTSRSSIQYRRPLLFPGDRSPIRRRHSAAISRPRPIIAIRICRRRSPRRAAACCGRRSAIPTRRTISTCRRRRRRRRPGC